LSRDLLASEGLGLLRAVARFLAGPADARALGVAPKAAGSGQGMALAALWDSGGVVVRGHAAAPVLAAFWRFWAVGPPVPTGTVGSAPEPPLVAPKKRPRLAPRAARWASEPRGSITFGFPASAARHRWQV